MLIPTASDHNEYSTMEAGPFLMDARLAPGSEEVGEKPEKGDHRPPLPRPQATSWARSWATTCVIQSAVASLRPPNPTRESLPWPPSPDHSAPEKGPPDPWFSLDTVAPTQPARAPCHLTFIRQGVQTLNQLEVSHKCPLIEVDFVSSSLKNNTTI